MEKEIEEIIKTILSHDENKTLEDCKAILKGIYPQNMIDSVIKNIGGAPHNKLRQKTITNIKADLESEIGKISGDKDYAREIANKIINNL